MNVVTIVAETAAEALAEVHRRLGPDAVVVNVRRLTAPGLSRIWKKPQVELQATVPSSVREQARKQEWAEVAKNVSKLRQQLARQSAPPARTRESPEEDLPRPPSASKRSAAADRRPTAVPAESVDLTKMLENLGLLPLHAQWLADQVRRGRPTDQDENLREQFEAVQELLLRYWDRLAAQIPPVGSTLRVLVGTAGVGKTTCLCKWLTQEVLLQNRTARVWRLDGDRANTAELLSIHGEILGVPVERVWTKQTEGKSPDVQFVDLPGVPADDASAIEALKKQLEELQPAQVFLVLNAAYDLNLLLAQVRAFSGLDLSGLILTHLDEETRWSKFWNLLLSSKQPVLYLCGGQNIPGHFSPASPQSLFEVTAETSENESPPGSA